MSEAFTPRLASGGRQSGSFAELQEGVQFTTERFLNIVELRVPSQVIFMSVP